MKSYLEHFFSFKCSPDVLPFFGPNRHTPKEITESMAMWRAATDILHVKSDDDILAIVIGDGKRPRTAGLLSHVTKWDCVSIDPIADLGWFLEYEKLRRGSSNPLERIVSYQLKAEHAKIACEKKRTILFLPHSHATMSAALNVPY